MGGKRNLLIVLAHGLRCDALGDERAWPLTTTYLEALGQRGLRLIAGAASPADPGGMASLLTGLHARQHGLVADQTHQRRPTALSDSLVHRLVDAGYHVAGVGCVGMVRHVLHETVSTEDVAEVRPADCAYYRSTRSRGVMAAVMQQRRQRLRSGPFEPDRLMLEPEEDIDGFIASRAGEMIEAMPEDKPWALLVIFSGPGNDLPPPTLYDGIVPADQLKAGFAPLDMSTLDELAEPAYPRSMLQRLEAHHVARIRADYLGRVSLIDYAIRRMSRAVEQRADRGRVWTVLGSDRGHLLGEHGLIGHRSFLSGAVETPMIVAPPVGHAQPRDPFPDALFSTVDFAPTVTALAGADMLEDSVGRSLLPLFHGNAVTPLLPGGLVSEFSDRMMLETQRYKAVFHRGKRRCVALYDLLNDSDERNNLVDRPMASGVIDALRVRVADALLPLRASTVC